MATAITIPDIGTTVDHVMFVKWLVKVGDTVRRGDLLCEVETDKAVSELESIAEGTVLKLLAEPGTEIQQGTTVAYVGQPGEALENAGRKTQDAGQKPAVSSPRPEASPQQVTVPPVVRNLAQKEGVDLSRVTGTGPGGRITSDDVRRAKAAGPAPAKGKPLPANQVAVGRRVSRSHREIPPISLTAHIDMTGILRLRKGIEKKAGQKPSFDAFFVMAAAITMRKFAHFRSLLDQEHVIESDASNIGVAIGVDRQLFVPVVHGADVKGLSTIDAEIRALAAKAGAGTLTAAELSGAALTVTNLGMFPVLAFQAIIPPDQAAVLAVGMVEDRVVMRAGTVTTVPTVTITLTVDHRLINGREAGEFVAELKKTLEGVA